MMNEREILILQIKQWTGEWEDITRQVQWFDAQKNACRIKYVGNATFYWKSYKDLIIYDKPVIVDTIGKIIYCDKVPVKGVYQIIVFNEFAKLFFTSGNTKLVNQADIDKQFDNWWQRQAKQYYQSVLDKLYPIISRHNIIKPTILVAKMQTLWGSCSRKLCKINLNYYLYKASVACIEYVVFHEMMHLMYPNHDKNFYEFLTIYMPDWKERKKQLDYEFVLGV